MDQVCVLGEPIAVRDDVSGTISLLPGADVLAKPLSECPLRYVLSDAVAETCTRLAFEDDTILETSLDLLRSPAPSLWLEFRGAARQRVFATTGRLAADADSESSQRLGLLIRSDETGRRGTIETCWETHDGSPPEAAPFVIEFDLDQPWTPPASASDHAAAAEAGIAYLEVSDCPQLAPLFRKLRLRFRPEWRRYYQQRCPSPAIYVQTLQRVMQPAGEDVPFFAAFALMLMAHNATHTKSISHAKLNKARAKQGRPPLLDHLEMSLDLNPRDEHEGIQVANDRSPSRLHLVRGHLVRRGQSIHWRSAHMRGRAALGSVARRTVTVRFAAE